MDKYWYRPRSIQVDLLGLSPYTKNPKDCAGVENGNAFFDTCGHCAGGTTGIEPCLSGVAKIYTHANYSGTGIGLNAGEYTANELLNLGFETNALSSFNLNNGYVIELYAEDNFQGEMKEFENSVSDLSEKSFDNQTKSLIIRRKGIENIEGVFAVQNKQSQLFLDVEGGSTANNALIIQSSYKNNDSQKFRLNHLGKGVYTIQNVGSEKYLNIIKESKSPKSYVEQWDGKEYDIIFNGGEITSQYSDSPTGLEVTKLIDKNTATKFLTFHDKAWIQFKSSGSYILGRYCLTSANDAPARDPASWTISGSNDGQSWTEIDSQSGIVFTKRFEEESFNVNSDVSYSYFKIDITCNSGSVLQFAELKLFGKTNIAEGDYSNSQKFIIVDAGNDFVKLINKNSDLMLEITDGFTNEGEKVWQNSDFGQWGGFWKLIDPSSLSNGVEIPISNKNIVIYPNPASDYLSIESTASEIINRIIVTDLSGRIIQDKTYNDSKLTISLSNLKTGLYLLKINTDKGSYSHILIKN